MSSRISEHPILGEQQKGKLVTFTYDGKELQGYEGEPIAAALKAAGVAATKLLHHMSRIFQSNSVPPSNPAGIRIDSKRRRRLMEKRMAMGHRADDHEEQTQYQQSM